jgi:hypothetical protein
MLQRLVLMTALLATLAVKTGGNALSSPEKLPGLLTQLNNARPFAVRPEVVLYTGDGTGVLKNLHWTIWTHDRAIGFGMNWVNNCKLSCARTKSRPLPASVSVFRVRNGHFTRIRIQDRGARPATLNLCGGPGYYSWGVIPFCP